MSQMTKAQRERLRLFHRGVSAAQRYTGSPEHYLCPICGTAFTQSALFTVDPELTREHAPPKAVGGKVIALTCKSCNRTGGHSIDAALSGRARQMHFADVLAHARDGEGGQAELRIGSECVNIRVVAESNSPVRLEILGKANNDLRAGGAVERISAYVQEHARENTWTGGDLVITTSKASYNPRLALIGDLRAAFLVAFAAFGYRYAFDQRLTLVRQQILAPDAQLIDGWGVTLTQTEDDQSLLLLTEPIPAVMVKLGRIAVLLPWLDSPLNFYDVLATTHRPNGPLQGSGQEVKWPTTLEMVLDLP